MALFVLNPTKVFDYGLLLFEILDVTILSHFLCFFVQSNMEALTSLSIDA